MPPPLSPSTLVLSLLFGLIISHELLSLKIFSLGTLATLIIAALSGELIRQTVWSEEGGVVGNWVEEHKKGKGRKMPGRIAGLEDDEEEEEEKEGNDVGTAQIPTSEQQIRTQEQSNSTASVQLPKSTQQPQSRPTHQFQSRPSASRTLSSSQNQDQDQMQSASSSNNRQQNRPSGLPNTASPMSSQFRSAFERSKEVEREMNEPSARDAEDEEMDVDEEEQRKSQTQTYLTHPALLRKSKKRTLSVTSATSNNSNSRMGGGKRRHVLERGASGLRGEARGGNMSEDLEDDDDEMAADDDEEEEEENNDMEGAQDQDRNRAGPSSSSQQRTFAGRSSSSRDKQKSNKPPGNAATSSRQTLGLGKKRDMDEADMESVTSGRGYVKRGRMAERSRTDSRKSSGLRYERRDDSDEDDEQDQDEDDEMDEDTRDEESGQDDGQDRMQVDNSRDVFDADASDYSVSPGASEDEGIDQEDDDMDAQSDDDHLPPPRLRHSASGSTLSRNQPQFQTQSAHRIQLRPSASSSALNGRKRTTTAPGNTVTAAGTSRSRKANEVKHAAIAKGKGKQRAAIDGRASRDRELGESWVEAGVKFRISRRDGEKRRLVWVREWKKKYDMPKDSKHPDAQIMHKVNVERWLTDEEYEAVKSKKRLATQSSDEEDNIKHNPPGPASTTAPLPRTLLNLRGSVMGSPSGYNSPVSGSTPHNARASTPSRRTASLAASRNTSYAGSFAGTPIKGSVDLPSTPAVLNAATLQLEQSQGSPAVRQSPLRQSSFGPGSSGSIGRQRKIVTDEEKKQKEERLKKGLRLRSPSPPAQTLEVAQPDVALGHSGLPTSSAFDSSNGNTGAGETTHGAVNAPPSTVEDNLNKPSIAGQASLAIPQKQDEVKAAPSFSFGPIVASGTGSAASLDNATQPIPFTLPTAAASTSQAGSKSEQNHALPRYASLNGAASTNGLSQQSGGLGSQNTSAVSGGNPTPQTTIGSNLFGSSVPVASNKTIGNFSFNSGAKTSQVKFDVPLPSPGGLGTSSATTSNAAPTATTPFNFGAPQTAKPSFGSTAPSSSLTSGTSGLSGAGALGSRPTVGAPNVPSSSGLGSVLTGAKSGLGTGSSTESGNTFNFSNPAATNVPAPQTFNFGSINTPAGTTPQLGAGVTPTAEATPSFQFGAGPPPAGGPTAFSFGGAAAGFSMGSAGPIGGSGSGSGGRASSGKGGR